MVYLLAVFHRTTLGVAGLEAAQRFDIGAAALAGFTVLQIGVYAAMQIPTGLLVDRFGPRVTLSCAALLMGSGQLLFAYAESYVPALLARGVLGLGDALAFVSVLRLVAAHYSPRRYPTLTAATAALGSVGNFAATVPLTLLLADAGWTTAFAVVGLLTAAYAGIVVWRVRDAPHGEEPQRSDAVGVRQTLDQVRQAWRVPGTRLRFWVHMSTCFAPNVLGLLWGLPYLVQVQGLTEPQAGVVLSLMVIVAMVCGPAVGELIGRHPAARMPIVLGYLGMATVIWTVIVAWSGSLPTPVTVTAIAVLAAGGPMSGIAFALVRDYNPLRRVGTASGIANVGGFGATTVASLAVGVLIGGDAAAAGADDFRLAFAAVLAMLVAGAWRTTVWWLRARAVVLAKVEAGETVPVQIRRRAWDITRAA
ncbi:nitrate/nitrite transporter [Actinokineospora sp. UTMC 2448]|uniref:MFS transporter n=1 Tax=Actinokineospora sp. UTMC 2448 TaxID=2268449 RepID=UPI002164ED49|nr:MFS transporter [Actinokineospora sp. UTMC 2448]